MYHLQCKSCYYNSNPFFFLLKAENKIQYCVSLFRREGLTQVREQAQTLPNSWYSIAVISVHKSPVRMTVFNSFQLRTMNNNG